MNQINLKISTPTNTHLQNEVVSVQLCSSNGWMTILPNHIPIVCLIVPGYIMIKFANGNKKEAVINYGVCRFDHQNNLTIVTDFFHMIQNKSEIKKINQAIEYRNNIISSTLEKYELSEKMARNINRYSNILVSKLLHEQKTKK